MLTPGTSVSLCGIRSEDRKNIEKQLVKEKCVKIVPWSPALQTLIVGRDYEGKWKYAAALKAGIRILSVEDALALPLPLPMPMQEYVPPPPLWTEKYRPTCVREIIGNGDAIATLQSWLARFAAGKCDKDECSALITGPPGIGKTTAVHNVAKEAGYEIVEMNASDERSALAIRRVFQNAVGSGSVGKKRVIIMDEVDGMSSGDRGGIGELARVIRESTTFPILCIANDRGSPRLRPLAAVCADIRFQRPYKSVIARGLLTGVCRKENVRISQAELETLCEKNGNDLRQILNFLQFGGVAPAREAAGTKDETLRLDAFSSTKLLFSSSSNSSIEKKTDYVFVDHSMVPLMVAEGYLAASATGRGNDLQKLECVVSAADHLGAWDMIDHRIHRNQAWGLLPAACTEIVGAASACGGPAPFQIFPSWLGKQSRRTKMRRMMKDMRTRCRFTNEEMLDCRDLLRNQLFMLNDASTICDTLESHHLTRDNMMEALAESTFKDSEEAALVKKMDSKLKGALTREWKKRGASTATATATAIAESEDVVDGDEDDEYEEEMSF